MASVHDVAQYILEHFEGRPISTMKLQKLVFFAQGWSFGVAERPIFPQQFQAWAKGPVCYDLFRLHKGDYSVSHWPAGNSTNVSGSDKVIVDAVLSNYGALSGLDLSELTHRDGTPWALARKRAGAGEGQLCREHLADDDMREYFTNLLSLDSNGQH